MSATAAAAGSEPKPEQKSFRLLDLPPELWVEIGKLAVDEHVAQHGDRSPGDLSKIFSISLAISNIRSLQALGC
ncbi:hypothetical protein CLAFUW4_01487 [Fulvia fulva]|uniref:Uncharacterized protein n=1 Tax=Passalora fulva TaxID=5499 RepID=A0A9Q8P3A0_PASFU|nr:uncharacterized protein CLAFUR5_01490 [Fulvia fulva]KAK4634954.1 hypothetical protein CLAFUR4_01488 [Fulvia fulva]KAK4636413.1 hypothetical protein CLAFUR0_01489 [Fulvia fulva]UJO11492.1 hypothetical protein CLAFUR5_01490 [Fulvia fulva]WPV08390.1 hypothetical protein CLAFUW4_01487 [Fulvia fulva]WPV24782.1 hypothetical protein CLAFUW7_01492 [Fulvia fulva]